MNLIVSKRFQSPYNVAACDLSSQFGSFGFCDRQTINIALILTAALIGVLTVADTVQKLFLITTEAFFGLDVSDIHPDIYLVSITCNRKFVRSDETCDTRPVRGI